MRNLKKVLSLSLALVMLLGMMVVGAGAATALDAYSDKGDITYKEAVDLLTAIDVLQGDEGGFRPTDTLTREQAAKIVATVALGVDAAEALTVTKAPYTDVAATRWSAGYIAYCANVGIINGMGDGTYHPTDAVTGYQFAKMLLCVLGYGANDEYVGSNWSLNVAKDGVTTGLFSRLSNVGNSPATREEAAQLAFNAITLPMVAYSALYGTYSSYTYTYGQQELLGNKADKIFKVAKVNTEDGYGYNYHYWKFQNAKAAITDQYLSDSILGTVTGGKEGAMYKDYDWNDTYTVVENGVWNTTTEKGSTTVTNYASAALKGSNADVVNYRGQTVTLVDEDWDGDVDKLVVVTEYLAEVTKVTPASATADRTVTVKAYIPNTNAGYETVTAVIETEDYAVGDMILVDPNMTLAQVKGAAYTTAVLAQVQAAFGANVLGTRAAEVLSAATVTAFYANVAGQTGGSVTTGGAKYSYNGVFADKDALGYDHAVVAGDNYSLNKGTYNFYLDSNGNVIGAKVVEDTIKDYAYILAVGEDSFKMDNDVKVLLSNGTVGTYTVSGQSGYNYDSYAYNTVSNLSTTNKIYDSTPSASSVGATVNDHDGLAAEGVGRIYGYSFDASGNIILTALTGAKYNNAAKAIAGNVNLGMLYTFTKGYSTISYKASDNASAAFQSVFATDTTVFAYINNGVVTLYTGKSNAPSIDKDNAKAAAIATQKIGNTTYATFVVILGAPEADMGTNFVYVTSAGVAGKSTDTKGAPVYYYNVVKDGVRTTIATTNACNTSDLLATGTGVYRYAFNADLFTSDDLNKVESGEYTMQKAVEDDGLKEDVKIDVSSNGNVIVNQDATQSEIIDQTNQYIITDETKITDVSGPVAVENATFNVGDTVTVVFGKQGSLQIAKAVFITTRAVGTGPITPSGVGGAVEDATITMSGAGTGTIAVVDRYNVERDAMTIATDKLIANGFTVDQIVGTSIYATAANGTQVYFTVTTTVAYAVNLAKASGANVAMNAPATVYAATTGTPISVALTLSGANWGSETGTATSDDTGKATVASVTDTKNGNVMTVSFTVTGISDGATVTIGW